MTITSPGFYGLPEAEYHADPVDGGSLSQSGAKLLLKAPAKYRWDRDHPSPSTASMNLGTAAHRMVLGKGSPVVTVPRELLSPDGGVRSAEARAWKAEAIADGYTVVSATELEVINLMAGRLREHPVAGPLFARPGRAERAMFWRDDQTGVWRRGLVDWLLEDGTRPILVDYKTTEDASPDAFSRAIYSYGYHIQAPWYLDGYSAVADPGVDPAFVFVVQEKTAPYLVAVYELDSTALRIGAMEARRAIDIYQHCTATGVWPGYPTEVQIAQLPAWVENRYQIGAFA